LRSCSATGTKNQSCRRERDDGLLRWLGFGYLGERRHQNHQAQSDADLLALETAIGRGLTYGQKFTWANSKYGRWYGDCMFGCNGQRAEKYLPTKYLPA